MALSIDSEEAECLARELAERRGGGVAQRLQRLGAEVQRLPVLDDRPPDDIIGYDHNGLPV